MIEFENETLAWGGGRRGSQNSRPMHVYVHTIGHECVWARDSSTQNNVHTIGHECVREGDSAAEENWMLGEVIVKRSHAVDFGNK